MSPLGRRTLVSLALSLEILAAAAAASGCGGGAAGPAVGLSRPARAPVAPPAAGPTTLPAHAVAELDDDRALAAFARTDGGRGLLVFVQGGAWRSRAVDANGAPAGDAALIAPLQGTSTRLALRASGDGFVAAWDVVAGAGHTLWAVALDGAGKPRTPPVQVATVAERVAFVDVVVGGAGAFVLHEIGGRGPRGIASRVALTPLDPVRGAPTGASVVVADDVIGWNVAGTATGAAIARVVPPAPAPDDAPGVLGRIEVASIDGRGVVSPPIQVLTAPTAHLDVELVALGERLVVAWTDGAGAQGVATMASVELGSGKAGPPVRLDATGADVALVGVWAPARGAGRRALIAWEPIDTGAPQDTPRRFVLATVDGGGALSAPRAELPFVGPGRPDVVADGDGFAALVLAPLENEDAAEQPVAPTFVRLDADLAVRASAPLRAAPFATTDGIPDLAFGLSCASGGCLAVAGSAGAPAPLAVIELTPATPGRGPAGAPRGEPARAAAPGAPPPGRPEPAAPAPGKAAPDRTTAVWSGDIIADVAAARLEGGAELVAWVSAFEPGVTVAPPAPKGEKPFAATLSVRNLAGGTGVAPVVVSQRAMSGGGVALTPVPGAAGEVVLGWVASEDGIAQVFATRLDATGKKLLQKKVTVVDRGRKDRPRSTCSAVDVEYAPQAADGRPGLVIAWVDTRDGDAEIYAARLDARLQKVGADRRITSARGAATEVQILVRGAETLVAWIEARDGATQGDVYLARLHTGNLEPIGDAVRVFASPGPTRSVRFVDGGGGRVLLSWIDDAPGGTGDAAPGARLVEIDASGRPAGAPKRIAGLGTAVLDAAFACSSGACRGVGAVPGTPPRLVAVDVDPGGSVRDVGPAVADRAMIVPVGGAVFVVGDDDGRVGRLRALRP